MAKKLDWKVRWLIIMAGVFVMYCGQGSLLWILFGMAVALLGIYYGTKDAFLAYIKKRINRFFDYIKGFLPPF